MNKAVRALGVKIAILVLILIFVIGAIVLYLNSKKIEEKADKPEGSEKVVYDVEPVLFKYYSTYPGYLISLQNKFDIVNVFKEWQIFGRSYEYKDQSTNKTPLQNITLFLTDKKPLSAPVYGKNTYASISGGNLDIYILLNESLVNAPDINGIVTKNFIGGVYSVTHGGDSGAVDEAYKLIKSKNQNHFVLTKE